MIECRNISVSLGDHAAVRNVSVAIGAGELVGFIGPNGAGKTSFLRALLRLVPVDSGTIILDGKTSRATRLISMPEILRIYPRGKAWRGR